MQFIIKKNILHAPLNTNSRCKLKPNRYRIINKRQKLKSITLRILLVDDNEQITLLLSKILTINGHNVTTSNLFDEGMRILQKENFDVVIMDAPMPGYEKLSTIHELERKGLLQLQKIILFSGLDISNSTIMDLKTKGLYSYLSKPLKIEKLLQELASIPLIQNIEITEKRISEEQTKQKLENLRSSLSSLKLKLNPS